MVENTTKNAEVQLKKEVISKQPGTKPKTIEKVIKGCVEKEEQKGRAYLIWAWRCAVRLTALWHLHVYLILLQHTELQPYHTIFHFSAARSIA